MTGVWVFGYGSLVSPASFGRTLGREPRPGHDVFEAELAGFGRRWNYGVMHTTASWADGDGRSHDRTIVALGVVPSVEESINGVIGWVGADELPALDRRERTYDRVDVTHAVSAVGGGAAVDGPVMVYVPRRAAIEHYERARDTGTAAIEERYWNLVDAAFRALGPDHHARYHATTPAPDIPILPLTRQ
jgi:cation transport regulator ChaC